MAHNIQQLERLIENRQIKLEITGGIPTWEASPASRHQKAAKRIEESIQPLPGSPCGCYSLADTYISFPDGSLKRPDISIFCDEPPDSDEALEIVPVAVIEIVSPDKESARKDMELNPPVYLPAGVLDVIAFDPRTPGGTRIQGLRSHGGCSRPRRSRYAAAARSQSPKSYET